MYFLVSSFWDRKARRIIMFLLRHVVPDKGTCLVHVTCKSAPYEFWKWKKKETGKTCLIIRICMYICNQNKNFAVLQGYPDISPLMHSRYSSLKFVTFCPLPRKQTYAIFSLHSTGNGKMSGKVLSFLHHFNNVVWLLCIFGSLVQR